MHLQIKLLVFVDVSLTFAKEMMKIGLICGTEKFL